MINVFHIVLMAYILLILLLSSMACYRNGLATKKMNKAMLEREKQLDMYEAYLERKEDKLEKTLDYIRKRDSILGK